MVFSKYLRSTKTAAVEDCKTFREWEDGRITTEQCYEEFQKHNHKRIKRAEDIYLTDFEGWLNSLGYRRRT